MLEFKTIINSIKNLNWKKYFYKNLLVCFCVLFFIFFVVVAVIGGGYRNAVTNELKRYCYEVFENIKTSEEKINDTITRIQNELIVQPEYTIFMSSENADGELFTEAAGELTNTVRAYNNTDFIDSIYIYSASAGYIISGNSRLLTHNYKDMFLDSGWIDEYKESAKTVISRKVKLRGGEKEYFTAIFSYKNDKRFGLMAYNIDVAKLRGGLNESVRNIYVADDNDNIIYSLNNAGMLMTAEASYIHDIISRAEDGGTGLIITKNAALICDKIQNSGYRLIAEIDSSHYDMQLKRIKLIICGMIIFVAVAAAAQAFWLVIKYYDNLLDLVLAVEGRDGDSKGKKKLREIAFVKSRILSMMDKNAKVETELAHRIDIMNKTKMAALQSQINPHFLYNTLNLISVLDMREQKKDTDTVKAIAALSDILRYAMNANSYIVPLCEEIECLKKYIYIQSFKYKDRFDVNMNFDENTLDLKVLKMTLQPLVENSVFHGILPANRKCSINISSYIEDNMLKLRVEDDGIGISDEVLKKLCSNVSEESFDKAHTHGLLSVNQRCMLLFGEGYGCEITSDEAGTVIIVKYPILENEHEDNTVSDK